MDSIYYYLRLRGKVRGPFSVEQLRRMATRGQFSRMHQISVDQRDWQPATDLRDVFSPMASSSADLNAFEQQIESQELWHYALADRRIGPIPRHELQKLLQTKRLPGSTLVWKDGMSDWIPAELVFVDETIGTLPSKRNLRRSVRWIAGGVTLVGLSIGIAVLLRFSGNTIVPPNKLANHNQGSGQPSTPATRPSLFASNDEIASTDFSDPAVNERIKRAVGMVVCYLEINLHDGAHHELPLGHGTCFVVNSQGNAITNRHVIKDHAEWLNATESGRIGKLQSMYTDSLRSLIKKDRDVGQVLRVIFEQIATINPRCITYFGKKGFPTKIRFTSNRFDMSVLDIENLQDSPRFALSVTNRAHNLAHVIALGFPGVSQLAISEAEGAVQQAKSGQTVNEKFFGTASHLDKRKESGFQFTTDPGDITVVQEEMGGIFNAQHSATIRSGNSGGPLVFRDSPLAGTVYAINTLYLRNESPVYVAFPIAQMRSELEEDAKVPDLKWR